MLLWNLKIDRGEQLSCLQNKKDCFWQEQTITISVTGVFDY